MTDFYANLILSYVYQETGESAAQRNIGIWLQSDMEAKNLYKNLYKSRQWLDENLPIFYPPKTVVNNILHYAECV